MPLAIVQGGSQDGAWGDATPLGSLASYKILALSQLFDTYIGGKFEVNVESGYLHYVGTLSAIVLKDDGQLFKFVVTRINILGHRHPNVDSAQRSAAGTYNVQASMMTINQDNPDKITLRFSYPLHEQIVTLSKS